MIGNLIKASEERLKASNRALGLLQKENTLKSEVGEQMNLSIRSIYADFTPNNSAFEDLKSGANLNVIRDKNIIKALNHYFNRVEEYSSIVRVNAQNAIDIHYSHLDKFENGWIHSTNNTAWEAIDSDVKIALNLDANESLGSEMKYRLLNEALSYVSANARIGQLLNLINDEVQNLSSQLTARCQM
jgi:hypothetical protein